ncbi:unnamed protein product, partial [marine sediment metagenome]
MSPSEHQEARQPTQHGTLHEGDAPKIEKYFKALIKVGGSDLHIKAGAPAHMRTQTLIRATTGEALTPRMVEEMTAELLDEKQTAFFDENGSIDLAYEIAGEDRFRINVFRQRGNISLAVRRVTRDIPDFETLHLPAVMEQIANIHQGLILLSGPTGCGKSTTIASMLEHVNKTRRCHIVTIEDPIEYLYVDKKALVNQREIGIDVPTFQSALKYLMREDPDVVLIGELRDRETFQAALQASETGHVVFGTVHASGAPQTITRILDLFDIESRSLTRQSLAFNLQAIICQKLLPCIAEDIDRIPAVEVLLTSPSVRQLIHEARDVELIEVIRTSAEQGMQDFTDSLVALIDKELVDPR